MSNLIRREEVDKAIQSICDLCGEDKKNNGVMCGACNLESFIRELDNIPSAEPERKWIPVTEALPEEDIDVLLQFPKNLGVGYQEDGVWNITTCDDLYSRLDEADAKPIAWMPLPKPYRGE